MRYSLSRLSGDERALLALLAQMAPNLALEPLLQRLRTAWHASYPPFREVLHDDSKRHRAIRRLQRAQLLGRTATGPVLPRETSQLIRECLDPDLAHDAVSNGVMTLGWLLDDGADPQTWPDWEVLAPHVETLGDAVTDQDLRVAVRLLNELSAYRRKTHEPDQARQAAERAIELAHRVVPVGHADTAHLLCNRAMAMDDLGQTEDALAILDKAVEILELRMGDGPQLAGTLNMRGGVLRTLGEYKRSIADRLRGIVMLESLTGANSELGELYNDLAVTYERYGDYDAAIGAYRRVQDLVGDDYGGAEATLNEGLLLLEHGPTDEAIPVLHRAEDALAMRYPRCSWRVWRVNQALGAAYGHVGPQDRADHYLAVAVAINDEAIERGLTGL
jgi:tetratricopeptide (TPR) repeat protein